MTTGPDRYQRFVRWMRIVVPAAVVALAVVTLLWPLAKDTEVSFLLSHDDVARSDDQVRMVNPRYQGTDAIDRQFTVSARSGVQNTPDAPAVSLDGIMASMERGAGISAHAEADAGLYLVDDQRLKLDGEVVFETGDGYRLVARQAEVDLARRIARGDAPVTGSGPLGVFEAQRFEIRVDAREAIFDGGVRMHIDPKGRLPDLSTGGPPGRVDDKP